MAQSRQDYWSQMSAYFKPLPSASRSVKPSVSTVAASNDTPFPTAVPTAFTTAFYCEGRSFSWR